MTIALHALDCISFGVRFRLRAESQSLTAKMLQCAPLDTRVEVASGEIQQFTLVSANGDGAYQLMSGDDLWAESDALQELLNQLGRELMVRVADLAPDRVFVHAGVVGWQGGALILPGKSFAGKSTLVAELVRAGATYYSDEYAVLDERGEVHPYARDLQMREAGAVEQGAVAVERIGGCAGDGPLPVAKVVFTEYVDGARWQPEPVSEGMAVLEMMRHAIPVQRTPGRVMCALAKVMEKAKAVRSMRGEAGETARVLLSEIHPSR